MFQAVFAWSEAPIGMIEGWFAAVGTFGTQQVPEGNVRSFLADVVINVVGSVVASVPHILVLFFFILLLEATGYMVHASFIMYGLLARVGISGRPFLRLL